MKEQWMPGDQWEALVRGDGCPLCSTIKSTQPFDEYGYTVADLSFGRLRLCANQYIKGYCVLISHKHVREPYELPQDEQAMFFDDMMRAGLALENVYKSIKMNFEILGNAVPHLHCHIEPRYFDDGAPNRPIYSHEGNVTLKPEEYARQAEKIRTALKMVKTG